MSVNYNPKVSTDNFVTCVDVGNPKGLIDLLNNSSIQVYQNSNTLTYNGVTGISFTGETPSVSSKLIRIGPVPSTGIVNGNWYMETWCYPLDTTNQNIIFMTAGNDGTGWCLPTIYINSSKIVGQLWDGGSRTIADTDNVIANRWYHIGLSWDTTNKFRLFVNGQIKATDSTFTTYSASSVNNYCWMGGNLITGCASNQGKNFNGGIAYFSFRNTVVTTTQVQQNFNALRGRFGI